MKKYKIAIVLGTMCLLLTLSICIQTRTIKEATSSVGNGLQDNSGLRDELFGWQSKYKSLCSDLENLEKKLEQTRKQVASSDDVDSQNETELKQNQSILGLTGISGSGLVITLDDNRNVDSSKVINISDYLVHEGDLLKIVNELFNAGADAVSINGQRVVSTTPILCDGNIIRVNGEKIGVPITINSIGYSERLYYALVRPGSYLEKMVEDGVNVTAQKSDNITISKYEGIYNSDYIKRGDV